MLIVKSDLFRSQCDSPDCQCGGDGEYNYIFNENYEIISFGYIAFCKTDDNAAQVGSPNVAAVSLNSLPSRSWLISIVFYAGHHGHFLLSLSQGSATIRAMITIYSSILGQPSNKDFMIHRPTY